jgi:hypothetical protein
VVVGDDEDAHADPCAPGGRRERLGGRQRVPALPLDGEVGQLVDAQEGRAGNVRFEVRRPPRFYSIERVGAVDEPVRDQ